MDSLKDLTDEELDNLIILKARRRGSVGERLQMEKLYRSTNNNSKVVTTSTRHMDKDKYDGVGLYSHSKDELQPMIDIYGKEKLAEMFKEARPKFKPNYKGHILIVGTREPSTKVDFEHFWKTVDKEFNYDR